MRCVLGSEYSLPCCGYLYTPLDFGGVQPWHMPHVPSPCVVRCLEQARHDTRIVVFDGGRSRLKAHVSGVRQIVRLPPSLLLPLLRERHQTFALRPIGDPVERAKVPDITLGGAPLASFHPADLGR